MSKMIKVDPSQFIFAGDAFNARPQVNPNDKDYSEFVQLKKAISDQGILNIFSVTQRPEGFLVLDGNCRALAIQQLSAEGDVQTMDRYPDGVDVQLMDMDDAGVLLTQISGNANVKKQKAASLAKALHKALLMVPDLTIDDLARRAGMDAKYVEQLLKLNLLPDSVKADIDAGNITATNGFHLNKLPTELLTADMIAQAKKMSGQEFANTCDVAKKAFIAAKKSGEASPEADGEILFHATPKLRLKAELEGMYTLAIQRAELEPTEANIAVAEFARWVFRMDESTLESDRAAFELARADKESKAKERAAARAADKTKKLLASMAGDPIMMAELAKIQAAKANS
jgi:hypothetical protein